MSPFGLENKRPIFKTDNCTITDELKFVGKESQIVKSFIMDSSDTILPFISFSKKDELINLNSPFDILYNVNLNTFSGQESIELTIRELYIKK